MPAAPRVLLIEDDDRARRALRLALLDEGFDVSEAADGRQGLQLATDATAADPSRGTGRLRGEPDVALLDLALPDMDGLDVLRRIRQTSYLPVIIVSGRADSSDIVTGLQIGADDYVTKPVVAPVLTARVHALLRRVGLRAPDPVSGLRFGNVVIHPQRQQVLKDGAEAPLTKTEFRLLCELAATPGEVVTREQLLMRVWDYDYFGDTRLLDVHIRRLRTKVEDDPNNPRLISTVRGVGYKLQD